MTQKASKKVNHTNARKTTAKSARALSISPQEYAEFIGQLELSKIWIRSAKLEYPTGPDRHTDLAIEVTGRIDEWNLGKAKFDVFPRFNVQVRADGGDIAQIDVEFGVRYESPQPMTERLMRQFHQNVQVNVWPFLRQFVFDAASRFGWEPLTLPTLKVGAPPSPAPQLPRGRGKRRP